MAAKGPGAGQPGGTVERTDEVFAAVRDDGEGIAPNAIPA